MAESGEVSDTRGSAELSDAARELYDHGLAQQGNLHVPPNQPGLHELLAAGFAVRNAWAEDTYLLEDPHHVLQTHVQREVENINNAVARIRSARDLIATLPQQQASGETGIQYLDNKDLANAEITKALARVRKEVWTAHPHDRDKKVMLATVKGDSERLERGIALRTIYLDSARSRKWQADWAAAVTKRGAEVRTLPGGFLRMVMVDDVFALVPDNRPGHFSRVTAWKVTHPGMLAILRAYYEQQWARAEPWMGGHMRPTQGSVTTQVQRTILRDMSAGKSQAQIADRMRVSVKTVQNHLSALYNTLGITPGDAFRLGEFWRSTEERFLP
ncbi:LuxR C-terminal-related transcriptional regulator [Streptomyces sp. NPDC057445]|uniref:LuxR C-terminal-related transcriptional regulator n=1 Tax=Streptomyces sp. NPDC057445 TaxID=3346136 RepID=UPI0036A025D8